MEGLSVIEKLLEEKTLIIGMGNYLRCDDAAGLYIVDRLRELVPPGSVEIMNVEDILESYVIEIAEKDHDNVLIFDAVDSGGEPGTVAFGKLDDLLRYTDSFSTHSLSLRFCDEIFSRYNKTAWLFGITAAVIDFGTEISEEVKKSADAVIDILCNSIPMNMARGR